MGSERTVWVDRDTEVSHAAILISNVSIAV